MAPKIIKKPGPGNLKVERMRLIYTKAEQNIIKELTRKRSLELVDYSDLAALERVQKILRDMTDEAEEYIPMALKEKFYKADDLSSAPYGYYNAEALTGTQTAIVERLVDNLLADIDEAAAVAYKSAEEYLAVGRLEADALRNAALEMVAKLESEGKGWNTIQNQMAAALNAKGITSFVDKAGRQWGLSSYCSMATRTTARQAEVAAALTSDDWDLWQIVKIGSTCPLCSIYEGRVYSKSGTDPDYPPLSTAFGKIDINGSNNLANTYLNIHPNCLHSLIRYTTMGKTEEQIQRDKDFSSFQKRPANVDYRSKKQVRAYREKEQARAQYRNDVKQFKKYKAALGNDMPKTFETFEKHKKAGDEVYKGWEEKFRMFSRNEPDFLKEQRKGDIIKLEQVLVERDPIITGYSTAEQVANHFLDIKIDSSFSTLGLNTQKEVAQGWNYIKDALGEKYLPKTVRVAKLEEKTNARVTPSTRRLIISDKLTETEGFLTAVHESVHIADYMQGDIAESVLKEAFRDMGIRKKKDIEQALVNSMGLSTYFKYRNDYSEQLAWCFEKSLRSDKTAFSEAVQKVFLRRCRQ